MKSAATILETLKDFQVDTVEYAFSRLWDEEDPTDRFLVADEVGLGKTMVAKGLVAKTVERLQRQRRRNINIVYVSSNAHIARQNLSRLNAVGASELRHADRLTLLPTALGHVERNRVNFISLTPGTSLETGNSLGRGDERALLYRMVAEVLGEATVASDGWIEMFRGNKIADNFRWDVEQVRPEDISRGVLTKFARAFKKAKGPRGRALKEELAVTAAQFEPLRAMGMFFRRNRTIDESLKSSRNRLIGTLRNLVAGVSLEFLKPDLIILDEFQRFKTLLDPTTESSTPAQELAQQLFTAQGAKLLLLSATPYKMFTLPNDPEGNEHYSDFLATVEFLAGPASAKKVSAGLATMRSGIYQAKAGSTEEAHDKLRTGREQVEKELRRVMSRTERLAETDDRNGMLVNKELGGSQLVPDDVRGWLTVDGVRRRLGVSYDGFEYWRSSPYPLSIMNQDGYQVARELHTALGTEFGSDAELQEIFRKGDGIFPWDKVERFEQVPPGNPKLRQLMKDVLDDHQAWRIAWMPPSLPYYHPGGDYARKEIQDFSKRLVFSSWAVVPKAISAMVSYEAERRRLEHSPRTVTAYGKRLGGLLRPQMKDGRPGNLAAVALMYPSVSLARMGDPLEIARDFAKKKGTDYIPEPEEVLDVIEARAREQIEALPQFKNHARAEEVDNRWYSVVPFLLDDQLEQYSGKQSGFSSVPLRKLWRGSGVTNQTQEEEEEEEEEQQESNPAKRQKELLAHLEALERIDQMGLGTPPENLAEVTAMFALASPGVVLLRAFARVSGWDPRAVEQDNQIRSLAFRLANRIRLLFNRQEVGYLLQTRADVPAWKALLQMAIDGNLQSVMDEYFHTLVESEGLQDLPYVERAAGISAAVTDALTLRAMPNNINDFVVQDNAVHAEGHNLSAHFAAQYGRQQSTAKTVIHESSVRQAFNSPFRPFVLASTSVGQEGLDFHNYSHSVVHWNLPSNPVDLEQREGRVHRYKGHAVRKNVAADFRAAALLSPNEGQDQNEHRYQRRHPPQNMNTDPWDAMFEAAQRERDSEASDIVPYWVYPKEGGASIERYVPTMPFSREERHLTGLLRSVSEYRQVIGQPRQDDFRRFLSGVDDDLRDELGVNLEPPALDASNSGVRTKSPLPEF